MLDSWLNCAPAIHRKIAPRIGRMMALPLREVLQRHAQNRAQYSPDTAERYRGRKHVIAIICGGHWSDACVRFVFR